MVHHCLLLLLLLLALLPPPLLLWLAVVLPGSAPTWCAAPGHPELVRGCAPALPVSPVWVTPRVTR
jgi:hypothetical protein